MKELSIEEKVKAYDYALERAEQWRNAPNVDESEEERIRKGIIKSIKDLNTDWLELHGITKGDALAWLEKQVHVDEDEIVKGIRRGMAISLINYIDANSKGMCLSNMECEGIENAIVNKDWDKVYSYMKKKLEKQGERKSVNKVEPKFKVGDWVVYTGYLLKDSGKEIYVMQVASVENDRYNFTDTSTLCFDSEKDMRLWTIQDAKEGDVLHSIGFHNDCIFIFNGLDNWKFDEPNGDRAVATGYCCLFVSADNMEFGIQGPDCVEVNTIKPATKKQRDLLFEKMHEAGYEWDADKKELKKIEQKIQPKFEVGDVMRSLEEAKEGITDGLPVVVSIDEEYYHCNNELISIKDQDKYEYPPMNRKQKPAWSEEDELRLEEVICMVEANGRWVRSDDAVKLVLDWLKSLKDRYTLKPSDEQIKVCKEVYADLLSAKGFDLGTVNSELNRMEEQLKKLKS